jgi:hypothetical protein
VDRRIKQGTQDRRPRTFELAPKLGLGTALLLANRPQNRAVGQI